MAYKKRIADELLKEWIESTGCVLVEGSKWCGKTTTAEQVAGSVVYMADTKDGARNVQLAKNSPSYLLTGETPRLIDEWQVVPTLWDAIRGEVDHRRAPGQFIITGSAVPVNRDEIVHSGTGRIYPMLMRPMTLWESEDSTGELSLASLFEQPEQLLSESKIDIEKLAYLVCRGGWPFALTVKTERAALNQAKAYYSGVVGVGDGSNSDISRADGVRRDPERVKRLMRSLSRNLGSQASIATIYQDIKVNEDDTLSEDIIDQYIKALRKIFVVEDMRAWNPNLRSKTAIRTADTRYFVDPSIAAAALGLGPKDLLNDLETFGLFFETMAVRDLRVYGDALGGTVYHYRDKNNLECDAVLHLENGNYGLIEIKLGGEDDIEKGAKVLKELADKIDTTRMKNPSFMMVLVGLGRYAYRRDDGVYVVPIGCLKP
jgi:hypothetical protein